LAGDAVYLHYPAPGELYVFDAYVDREGLATGENFAPREMFSDVLAVAHDGGETTYAVTRADALHPLGITRLFPDPVTRPFEWTPSDSRATFVAVDMLSTSDRVYVLGYASLRIFNAELALVDAIELPEQSARVLALDAGRGRLYIGCYTGLYALDLETRRLIEVSTRFPGEAHPEGEHAVQNIDRLVLDATGRRLFAIIRHPADWFGGTDVVVVDVGSTVDAKSWQAQTLFSTLEGRLLDLFIDEDRDRLLIASYDDHALIPIDLASDAGDPQSIEPRLPLGIQVSEVIVDEPGGHLYVSDSAGWVHVLDRRTYDELSHAYGGRHISLDAAHNRLYAGDPRLPDVTVFSVRSLARQTLAVERTIPQPGKPRADPFTGRVAIVNRRFYLFDGASGDPVGEWLPGVGQPSIECPGCYYTIGREAIVDAQRGLTATITYTPRPGKPGPRESIAYDPASGRAYYSLLTGGYVHFSSIAIYPDLSEVQDRGQPVLYLEGLSGDIRLDPVARRLYVARGNALFVLDSETLNRVGRVETEGWQPRIAAVDGDLGRLYTPRGSTLVVWTRQGAIPSAPLPPEPAVVTKTVTSILPSPAFARRIDFIRDHTLLATINGQLCRSSDGGGTWVRLRGGLPEFGNSYYSVNAAFSPDYANDRTIFAGIYVGETHGEGVYRSTDGGETWKPCSDGLYDLRVYRVVPSPSFARDRTLLAYARIQNGESFYRSTNGGDSWQLVLRQASYGTPPLPRPEELFWVSEHLPQFKCDFHGACQRSGDGGATWTDLNTTGVQLDRLVEYALSPHFAQDHTVYFLTQADLYRYRQDTRTWSICTLPFFGDRDYTSSLSSLATAATGNTTHDLFVGSHVGEFLRFATQDLPWVEVRPSPTPSPPTPTPTPCAQLVDERLRLDARVAQRLSCPTGPAKEIWTALQAFERGMMFWREDVRHAYVLQQDATWVAYEDTWSEGQPDRDPALVPSDGLYQPIRGFGKVWRERLGGPQARIGWATAPEHGVVTLIQPFVHGLVIRGEDDLLYILYGDGTWETQ